MARGFLLHGRPFKESSVIAAFVTDSDGRIDLLARSVRGARNRKTVPPMPFCQYEMSWTGRGNLRHLQSCEPVGRAFRLEGQNLFCGFYLNELLYRLLPHHEPEHVIVDAYADVLQRLEVTQDVEPLLRNFELLLLDALGYGLDLMRDVDGNLLDRQAHYRFEPEKGLLPCTPDMPPGILAASGATYLALGCRDFSDPAVRQFAKVVLRSVLALYLGNRPLQSRELFARPQ